MNAASWLVLAAVGALFILAVRRVFKKGAPCECGGNKKLCGSSCCKRYYRIRQSCDIEVNSSMMSTSSIVNWAASRSLAVDVANAVAAESAAAAGAFVTVCGCAD